MVLRSRPFAILRKDGARWRAVGVIYSPSIILARLCVSYGLKVRKATAAEVERLPHDHGRMPEGI